MKRRSRMSDPENNPQLFRAGRALDWSDPRLDRSELAESTSRVLQVLTTSLKRPGSRRGRSSFQTTKQYDCIHLVKQGGATPEDIHLDLPSDNELRLFLGDLITGSPPSLVSHDSAAFEDGTDDLPPPCLLNAFSSLSEYGHRVSPSLTVSLKEPQ